MTLLGSLETRRRAQLALANPSAYLMLAAGVTRRSVLKFFGGTGTLTFEVPVENAEQLRCAETLMWLRWHGATLTSVSEDHGPDYPHWLVDFGKPFNDWKISTPSGLWFWLEAVEPTIFSETFIYDSHYLGAELHDTFIVDAGAYVGDTALYYAQRGAHVLAIEPDPRNASYLTQHIKANPELKPFVTPVGAALANETGEMAFEIGDRTRGNGHLSNAGRLVTTVDLGTAFGRLRQWQARFEGTGSYALKMDIKGAETDVLRHDALGEFDRVLVEYSDSEQRVGIRELLMKRGFLIARMYKHNTARYDLTDHGTILAVKP